MTAPPRPFALVTGNAGKLAEARRITGWDIEGVPIDLPEIQALDVVEVARAKVEEAWSRVGRPLVVEEAGLGLAALNDFPGALVKWMLDAVGSAGIARSAHALGDDRATARCVLAYRDAEETWLVEARTEGRLAPAPRGVEGFGWDSVFQPGDGGLTYAELPPADKDATSHRGRAWRAFMARLAAPAES